MTKLVLNYSHSITMVQSIDGNVDVLKLYSKGEIKNASDEFFSFLVKLIHHHKLIIELVSIDSEINKFIRIFFQQIQKNHSV